MKTGVLLVNLGTPEAPTRSAVKKYLIEFLTDPRVIDIPWLKRQLLVRGLIIPFRVKSSTQAYQSIWTEQGSPLMVHSLKTAELLQNRLCDGYQVEIAMRYGSPSIATALKNFQKNKIKELIILPLFPQYASATTGSIFEKTFRELSSQLTLPRVTFIDEFHDHPLFIKAFQAVSSHLNFADYDHILFSFHGLPERQLKKSSANCCKSDCCKKPENSQCYAAQCHRTAYAIAKECNLLPGHYSICFQSRLGKEPWIGPFTSDRIKDLGQKGAKKILVFCPAFVADCLETLYEIAVEYEELFIHEGGETLDLVPGLNTHPLWIDALKNIIESQETKSLNSEQGISLEQVQDQCSLHALARSD